MSGSLRLTGQPVLLEVGFLVSVCEPHVCTPTHTDVFTHMYNDINKSMYFCYTDVVTQFLSQDSLLRFGGLLCNLGLVTELSITYP